MREAQLKAKEDRRAMILAHICPNCGYQLEISHDFNKRSPNYEWFRCARCQSTMGVTKRKD